MAQSPSTPSLRTDWRIEEVEALFDLPFPQLLFKAQSLHRQFFDPEEMQISTLMSIKTGACPEDCAYCPQSAHYDTEVEGERMAPLDAVVEAAKTARQNGATRFCMGAAWRSPKPRHLERVREMIRAVHELGLETCATLGMLDAEQARSLRDAGLDYYNHNLDTSESHYPNIISTRT
ncbi:MAG TPA: radical SAM protein, partial [Chromatiales bacterium]|nr:radical SAM protein [Chromatiales bacterium]